MARVTFAASLARHVACPPREVPGSTVGEVLEAYFAAEPQARSYVFDERGRVRRHVVIFVGDQQLLDRGDVGEEVPPGAALHVMQALAGG